MKDRNTRKKIATWSVLAASIVLVLCLACHIAVMASFKFFLIFEYATMPHDEYFHYTVTLRELPAKQSHIFSKVLYKKKEIPAATYDTLCRYRGDLFFSEENGDKWFQIRGVKPTEMLLMQDENGEYSLYEFEKYIPKSKEEIEKEAHDFYHEAEYLPAIGEK